jgi:hypothetical protein
LYLEALWKRLRLNKTERNACILGVQPSHFDSSVPLLVVVSKTIHTSRE